MTTGTFLLAAVMLAMPADGAKSAAKAPPGPTATAATAAATPAQPATPAAPAAVQDPTAVPPRISVADAHKAIAEGKAVLVDVRPTGAYDEEHAKGSISLPGNELYARS